MYSIEYSKEHKMYRYSQKGVFMLAIPLDDEYTNTISKLYGKAPFFGLLNLSSGEFSVIKNEVEGKGPQSAGFLKKNGATATIYYHMGEGVYKSFVENNMDVFCAEYREMSIDEILQNYTNKNLFVVDSSNYKEKLDPGNGTSCSCGCESN